VVPRKDDPTDVVPGGVSGFAPVPCLAPEIGEAAQGRNAIVFPSRHDLGRMERLFGDLAAGPPPRSDVLAARVRRETSSPAAFLASHQSRALRQRSARPLKDEMPRSSRRISGEWNVCSVTSLLGRRPGRMFSRLGSGGRSLPTAFLASHQSRALRQRSARPLKDEMPRSSRRTSLKHPHRLSVAPRSRANGTSVR
jgi:hypothetical protein